MTKDLSRLWPIPLCLMLLGGCVGSDTAILFTTNNLGLNVQATPTPTAEISFSRQEGLIAPEFEDGSVVPAAASMQHEIPLFAPIATKSGTVFSGGTAAQILATHPSDPTDRPKVTCVTERPMGWERLAGERQEPAYVLWHDDIHWLSGDPAGGWRGHSTAERASGIPAQRNGGRLVDGGGKLSGLHGADDA